MELGLIIGLLGLAFLLFYISNNLSEKHYLLKLICLVFILIYIILLSKTTLDYQDNCAILLSNTTNITNTTLYSYDYICFPNSNTTSTIFYKSIIWFVRIISAYIIIALILNSINQFKNKGESD